MSEFTLNTTPLETNPAQTGEIIKNNKVFKSGSGASVFKVDKYGVFAGGESFETAPWAVDYDGIQYVGASGEIKLDGPNKQIVVGGTSDIVIDGTNGTITTDKIIDKTHGFYGVFVRQIKTTDFVSNPVALPIYEADGTTKITAGLLSVYANWYQTSTQRLNFLPGINNATGTSYWSIQKDGSGNYEVRHLGGNQASEIPSMGYVVYTCLFNSEESTYF